MKLPSGPRLLLFFSLSLILSNVGSAAGRNRGGPSPEAALAGLGQVRERTILLLQGGDSTGPFRRVVTEQSDAWCRQYLATPFEAIEQDEADPIETTHRAAKRASEFARLAFAFSDPHGEYFHHRAIVDRVTLGLEDLLAMFESTAAREGNWYYWLIVIPEKLGTIGLLMSKGLPGEVMEDLIARMEGRLERMVLTGANASWEARNHIFLALLTDDLERLERAAQRVFVDVRYSNDSGVREDYAYLFHGRIPYAAAYGAGFAQTVSQFVFLFSDTPWAVRKEKADLISNLLLEHSQWFVVGNEVSMHVRGRRYEVTISAGPIVEAMLFLAHSRVERGTELAAAAKALIAAGARPPDIVSTWADELMQGPTAASGVDGFRFWPSAEMGVFRGKGYHLGFRQYSERVQDYEYLIRQGPEGWNLAMGAVNIVMKDGSGSWFHEGRLREDIDMENLPGVTSREGANPINPREPFSGNSGFSLNYGTEAFSGGCGWGDNGVAGFVLRPPYGDLIARKSLHFFPGGYWSLVSGISDTSEDPPAETGRIRTTILQRVTGDAKPTIDVSGGRSIIVAEEPMLLNAVSWLWVDGIGAAFVRPTEVWCRRKGSVVTVWLDHGVSPADARCAFAVLPGSGIEATAAFARDPTYRPIRNDLTVHAVTDETGSNRSLVFFEAGSCAGFSLDHPAIVHAQTSPRGAVVTLQNPLHTAAIVQVSADLPGRIRYLEPEVVAVTDPVSSITQVAVATALGRIYRFTTGETEGAVGPVAREDLSDLHRFKATAQSDPTETLLTVTMPTRWKMDGARLSIHGSLGHHLAYLESTDIVDELNGDAVVFRWDRAPPEKGETSNPRQLQRVGDFRLWYETDLRLGIDYFHVPLFNDAGEEIPNPDYHPDSDSPYRKRP